MKKGLIAVMAIILMVSTASLAWAASDLSGKKIYVDPGHGGTDSGAVGLNGLKEKDVNLKVATALKNCLTEYGNATVKMSRTGDTTVSLSSRVTDANNWGANRFISVHHNASTNRSFNSTATYSYTATGTSANLSAKVQAQLVKWGGLTNYGTQTANYYVLKYTNMPSILTEASFISNPAEEARLRDSAYLWREGYSIYKGVADHYGVGY